MTSVTSVAGGVGRMWWDDPNWESMRYALAGVRTEQIGESALHPGPGCKGAVRHHPRTDGRTRLQRHSIGATLGNVVLRPYNMSMNGDRGLPFVRPWSLTLPLPPISAPRADATKPPNPPSARRARKDEDVERPGPERAVDRATSPA